MARLFTEPKLIVASHNKGKLVEIAHLLTRFDVETVGAAALGLAERRHQAAEVDRLDVLVDRGEAFVDVRVRIHLIELGSRRQAEGTSRLVVAWQAVVPSALDVERSEIEPPCSRWAEEKVSNLIDQSVVDLLTALRRQSSQDGFDAPFRHEPVGPKKSVSEREVSIGDRSPL